MNSSVEIAENIEQASVLQGAFKAQRSAYLAQPMPDYNQRKQDLLTLKRMINENRDAIIAAISIVTALVKLPVVFMASRG